MLDKVSQTVLTQNIVYPPGKPQISSSIVTLAPGGSIPWHRHDAPLYGYILSGTLTVHYENGPVNTYPTGTALLEAIGTYHMGENLGKVPVRILIVNFGSDQVQNTVLRP